MLHACGHETCYMHECTHETCYIGAHTQIQTRTHTHAHTNARAHTFLPLQYRDVEACVDVGYAHSENTTSCGTLHFRHNIKSLAGPCAWCSRFKRCTFRFPSCFWRCLCRQVHASQEEHMKHKIDTCASIQTVASQIYSHMR